MRRLISTVLAVTLLAGSCASLTGCFVVAPRRARIGYIWVPGYYAPHHVWIAEHWGRR